MCYDNKYYFSDSHSCDPKGANAKDNGKACIIECNNVDEFVRICKRTTGSKNVQFTLDYVDVKVCEIPDSLESEAQTRQNTERAETQTVASPQKLTHQIIPPQTSVMAPIDVMLPNVEDELQVSRNLNEIIRKTTDNIVNVGHELKAKELAWYFLFPYGKNGLKEQRWSSRGRPPLYEEFERFCSLLEIALNELLAQIRCLGSPSYFVTFSSNDLNWLHQRNALLLANGRPDVDPSTFNIYETQQLIEKYPVVLSRHFMIRVNALMKYIKNEVFGRKVKDHWWRIEFQNRGSPHLHMVVGIEDHPEFNTEEGKFLLDRNCCCKIPTEEEPELHELVKKCQIHRHIQTCTKNNTAVRYRFNFPREECDETQIVSHSSDDFIRNGGRICLLKRRKEDAWVNNYHPELLRLWISNMDIQPCGSNEAIAYYTAKYLSKAEPKGLDSGIAQAIQQI
ncbi:ATP-dependent DNA helicase [Trichonephila clavata]|uniref:ATP-dependent DNA helicase n=1 Tax=Trichonephila clavata TaxID=2740835 RepID=A0A8X6IFR5_TRICU|nr:ATP-dependent DNA helicase [Trichonephila clavata]